MGVGDLMRSLVPAKTRVGVRCNYGLTELGKEKAENFSLEGQNWNVLAYLDENGPSTLRDIAEGVHMSEEKTKTALNRMINSGYVRVIAVGK